jgi:hypothetical protein
MYSVKKYMPFLIAVISFYWMVLKRQGLMMACNKLQLVAWLTYRQCCVWLYTGKNTYIYDQQHNRMNHLKIINLSSLALMKRFLWALAINTASKCGLDLCPNSVPWHIPNCPSAQPFGISVAVLLLSTLGHDTKHMQHFHLILPTIPPPTHTQNCNNVLKKYLLWYNVKSELPTTQYGV